LDLAADHGAGTCRLHGILAAILAPKGLLITEQQCHLVVLLPVGTSEIQIGQQKANPSSGITTGIAIIYGDYVDHGIAFYKFIGGETSQGRPVSSMDQIPGDFSVI